MHLFKNIPSGALSRFKANKLCVAHNATNQNTGYCMIVYPNGNLNTENPVKIGSFEHFWTRSFSEDGRRHIIVPYSEDKRKFHVLLHDAERGHLIKSWTHDVSLTNGILSTIPRRVAYGEDVEQFFLLVQKNTPGTRKSDRAYVNFEVWRYDLHYKYYVRDVTIHNYSTNDPNKDYFLALDVDAKAEVIVIAGDKLHIWKPKRKSLSSIPTYKPPRRWSYGCTITRDGSRVLASTKNNQFAVWNTETHHCIALLSNLPAPLSFGFPFFDGRKVVAGDTEGNVLVWTVPSSTDPGPTPLVTALIDVLNSNELGSIILDESFFLNHMKESNVQCVSDLLAGHNLVLLGIRTGVLTKQNIHRLGGEVSFFEENLYYPATKLKTSYFEVIKKVYAHAEKVGIIKSAFLLKALRELRADVAKDLHAFSDTIIGLSTRINMLEGRVDRLESITNALNNHGKNMYNSLGKLSINQGKIGKAVTSLADSLTNLQQLIRKKNRRETYAGIARCVLSFVPVIGGALGNAFWSAENIIGSLGGEDIVNAGTDAAKRAITDAAFVDLSDFKIVRQVFSEVFIGKLQEPAQTAMKTAVRFSSFGSISSLDETLTDYFKAIQHTELLSISDDCSKEILKDEEALVFKARVSFQYATRNQLEKKKMLATGETVDIINNLLRDIEDHRNIQHNSVDEDMIEDVFIKIADRGETMVSEETFIRIFLHIKEEKYGENSLQRIMKKCCEEFNERARPNNRLGVKMTARLIHNLGMDLVQNGTLQAEKLLLEENIISRLNNEFDEDQNRKIDEEEFKAAVMDILHLQ